MAIASDKRMRIALLLMLLATGCAGEACGGEEFRLSSDPFDHVHMAHITLLGLGLVPEKPQPEDFKEWSVSFTLQSAEELYSRMDEVLAGIDESRRTLQGSEAFGLNSGKQIRVHSVGISQVEGCFRYRVGFELIGNRDLEGVLVVESQMDEYQPVRVEFKDGKSLSDWVPRSI